MLRIVNRLGSGHGALVWGVVVVLGAVSGCYLDLGDGDDGIGGSGGPPPEPFFDAGVPPPFEEPVVQADTPPPALSGGTLEIGGAEGMTAVVADPDRDRILVVDLEAGVVVDTLALAAGDEPGRIALDGAGRAHVALRGSGELLTFALAAPSTASRRSVCPMPRGVAWQPDGDLVHVACRGGDLVSLPAAGGAPVRRVRPDTDLRDVVVDGDRLVVTRFRSAEILVLDGEGVVQARHRPPSVESFSAMTLDGPAAFEPAVAWRARAIPGGGVVVTHQRASTTTISPDVGGYGGGFDPCFSDVAHSTTTVLRGSTLTRGPVLAEMSMVVDVAVSSGGRVFLAGAGRDDVGARQVPLSSLEEPVDVSGELGCEFPFPEEGSGQPTAVAVDGSNRSVTLLREPARLVVGGASVIDLGGASVRDTGHRVFHLSARYLATGNGGGMACATCHPEGADDGHVWNFDAFGPRRTPVVEGGLTGTAPFHWGGDMNDLHALADEVFTGRMGGPQLEPQHVEALGGWVDTLPAPVPVAGDADAVERGRALFIDPDVECASCHSGPRLTNNTTVDVGTGEPLQVPSLVGVAHRAPYLHDGCAETLEDRFGACGGGDEHGKTSHLTEAEIDDLVAFLESL